MSDNIVTFTPNLFQVGESYSVSSRYEHTFIGKCVQFDPDKVVFETPYGNLPITPTMAVTQDYRFEQLHIREVSGPVKVTSYGLPSEPIKVSEEPQKTDDEFTKDFDDRFTKKLMEHIASSVTVKDPLGPLQACHGLVAGSADELDDELTRATKIADVAITIPELHKLDVPIIDKADVPVVNLARKDGGAS